MRIEHKRTHGFDVYLTLVCARCGHKETVKLSNYQFFNKKERLDVLAGFKRCFRCSYEETDVE